MPILPRYLAVPIFMSVVVLSYGCDDNGSTSVRANGVGPSAFGHPPFVSRGDFIGPDSVKVVRVVDPACPGHPPFLATFSLAFGGDGTPDVFLAGVQMQFVDTAGARAGTMTLGPSELTASFGSTTLPSFGTRAFPFAFPFGCVGLPTGTLTVVAVTGDGHGRERRTVSRMRLH